jgi:hypothetical protein
LLELQLRYSDTIEAELPGLTEHGGRPLESYHRVVADEIGLTARAAITGRLIDRLAQAVRAERDVEDLHVTLSRARAARITAVVVAALGAVLSAGGLFATMAAIPAGNTLFDHPARSAALAGLIVVAAGATGYGLFWLNDHFSRRQTAVRAVRRPWWVGALCAALAALVLATVVAGEAPSHLEWAGVACAALLLLGWLLFVAVTADFGADPGDQPPTVPDV